MPPLVSRRESNPRAQGWTRPTLGGRPFHIPTTRNGLYLPKTQENCGASQFKPGMCSCAADGSADLGWDVGSLIQLFQSCGRPIIALPKVGLGGQPWAERSNPV